MKSIFYKSIIYFLNLLPFRNVLTHLLRLFPSFIVDKFYQDLKIKGPFTVKLQNGESFKMIGFGGSISNDTFWKGLSMQHEVETGWIFSYLSQVSKIIFDIGANVGIYSLIAKAKNRNSFVYSFEPSQKTFNKLMKNVELNNFDIVCEKIALSNENGSSIFYDVPGEHQKSASLSEKKLKKWHGYDGEIEEYLVETQTLDDYCDSKNISTVDLVKIDVEMHEKEVIEGMQKIIKLSKPFILVEILTDEVGIGVEKFFDNKWSYFHLNTVNKLEKVQNLSRKENLWNYLLVHESKLDQLKMFVG